MTRVHGWARCSSARSLGASQGERRPLIEDRQAQSRELQGHRRHNLAGVSSGVLANVGPLVLFGIAGLRFQDARRGGNSLWTISLVLVASFVGTLSRFKELAALPVAAWGIGLLAGRAHPVKLRAVLVVALRVTLAFVGLAGQRMARPLGAPTDLPTASLNAMTRYDLESGTLLPARKHGFEVVGNLVAGLSRRSSGVEATLISHEPSLTVRSSSGAVRSSFRHSPSCLDQGPSRPGHRLQS